MPVLRGAVVVAAASVSEEEEEEELLEVADEEAENDGVALVDGFLESPLIVAEESEAAVGRAGSEVPRGCLLASSLSGSESDVSFSEDDDDAFLAGGVLLFVSLEALVGLADLETTLSLPAFVALDAFAGFAGAEPALSVLIFLTLVGF